MESSQFAYDGHFWRRTAAYIAQNLPPWVARYGAPVAGVAFAAILPRERRAVRDNLRRIRGEQGPLRDVVDVTSTFVSYAGCLAEVLSAGSKNAGAPDTVLVGRRHVDAVLRPEQGVIVATIHTGGWETVSPLFAGYRRAHMVMVMEGERDVRAREMHDAARRAAGLSVVHVGEDPLSSLPLLRHLREGNIVAMQLDRVPKGMRSVPVRLLNRDGEIPLGPLRLAQVSGVPIVPIFAARTGYRKYVIEACRPVLVSRRADDAELARAAQRLADSMTGFLREYPTQWFHFGAER